MNRSEMVPYRGFDDVLFGMTRDEVRVALGEPDEHTDRFYNEDDLTEVWWYHRRGIERRPDRKVLVVGPGTAAGLEDRAKTEDT